jgi:DNA-directed RNA polymerase alpha subunit
MNKKEEYKEIVNDVLIAPGTSDVTFKIPLVIPVQQVTAETDETCEISPLPVVTLDTKINDTDLSTRVKNGLFYKKNIKTVRDLLAIQNPEKLFAYRYIGHKSRDEIKTFLAQHGFCPKPSNNFVTTENT